MTETDTHFYNGWPLAGGQAFIPESEVRVEIKPRPKNMDINDYQYLLIQIRKQALLNTGQYSDAKLVQEQIANQDGHNYPSGRTGFVVTFNPQLSEG